MNFDKHKLKDLARNHYGALLTVPAVLLMLVGVASCGSRGSDNPTIPQTPTQAGVQQMQPQAQQTPVIIQQAPAAESHLLSNILSGAAGYMAGRHLGGSASSQPSVIERHYVERRAPDPTPVAQPKPASTPPKLSINNTVPLRAPTLNLNNSNAYARKAAPAPSLTLKSNRVYSRSSGGSKR